MNLILASSSPFRKKLLEQVGLTFSCEPPQVDERDVEKDFQGALAKLPLFLAEKKAAEVFTRFPSSVVVGSDQVLDFNGEKFHKPQNSNEAIERLSTLQGQIHKLHTGLCVLSPNQKPFLHLETATLKMHSLSQNEIADYVAKDRPIGCAGAYKIEKGAPRLFESIQCQDFYGIIGLPLLALLNHLRSIGYFD